MQRAGEPELSLAVSVFLACSVEAVEAFTIVLAVGSTRHWTSTLLGTGAAWLIVLDLRRDLLSRGLERAK